MKDREKYVGSTPKDNEDLKDMHTKVLEIFSNRKFERILDVGCADGNFSVLLKESCDAKDVYGIDISRKGVESAKRNGVKAFQLNIDEEDFPFEDDYFDAIFCGHLIEHLFDTDHLLDEVYRTLRGRGLCVISTGNLTSLYDRIFIFFGYQPSFIGVSLKHSVGCMKGIKAPPDHIRPFAHNSFKELLKIHNLKILKIKGRRVENLPDVPFTRLFIAMDKILSHFPSLSCGLIAIVEKGEKQ